MLECRTLSPEWAGPLAEFFSELKEAGDEKWFHPHPLTAAEADKRAHYCGRDFYYVLADGPRVLAYGMLRGWDEGYDVPSLGIAVRPSERGKGIGLAMMLFLHAVARQRGAEHIRLKVYEDNSQATQFYKDLGYTFQAGEGNQLVGVKDL